ncbi:MAG TPA: hypothetical protein DDY37_02840 [Legionella sp.]|nr:hypothetical protein [Legionella sp.]
MMSLVIKRTFLATTVALSMSVACAGPDRGGPKPDPLVTAETCRQLALKMDWLGRYQDRATCTANLDGLNAYAASQLILVSKMKDAQPLINNAIVHTKYAIDIGCYGQDDMKTVVTGLQNVLLAIA